MTGPAGGVRSATRRMFPVKHRRRHIVPRCRPCGSRGRWPRSRG